MGRPGPLSSTSRIHSFQCHQAVSSRNGNVLNPLTFAPWSGRLEQEASAVTVAGIFLQTVVPNRYHICLSLEWGGKLETDPKLHQMA